MTTTTISTDTWRPGLARLTALELRKAVDTRSGLWLQVLIAVATVAVTVLTCVTGGADDHGLRAVLSVTVSPASVLLPITGVLLVTSEWSQRTALTTFALVPDRRRILAAKVGAGTVLALVTLAFCLPVAAIGSALTADGSSELAGAIVFQHVVSLVTGVAMGVGFGAVFLAVAPATAAFYLLPIAWAGLGRLSFFEGAARWLDGSRTLVPLTEETFDATQWARAGATLAVWMLLPLVLGTWRVLRGEVS